MGIFFRGCSRTFIGRHLFDRSVSREWVRRDEAGTLRVWWSLPKGSAQDVEARFGINLTPFAVASRARRAPSSDFFGSRPINLTFNTIRPAGTKPSVGEKFERHRQTRFNLNI